MDRVGVGPFAAASFLGSFLLFTLELLAARLLLPRFGGAAYVWTASAAVFQGLLLGGYLYARGVLARRGERYFDLHLFLLLLPFLWLPLSIGGTSDGPHPALRLVCALLVSAGAPFFVLSTTSPVLQDRLRRRGVSDAYFLYAASNAGALAALLSYPILVEPALSVREQLAAWTALYGAFAALHLFLRGGESSVVPETAAVSTPRERRLWLILSAAPSAAVLATTNLLTLDFASVPLLWVIPLALYLLTFVLNFKRRPWYPRSMSALLVLLVVLWVAAVLVTAGVSADPALRFQLVRRLWVLNKVFFYCAALFIVSLICHRALALARPPDERASDYYVWLGLGGWLGSALVGLLLPVAARHLAVPELDWAAAGALALAGLLYADRIRRGEKRLETAAPRTVTLALCAVFALGLGFYAHHSPALRSDTLLSLRSFYGFSRVVDLRGLRRFYHGGTIHGAQSLDPARVDEPLLYYHRDSPGGEALALFAPGARRVAAFGLGIGSIAAYSKPGQRWDFYELDPDVIAVANALFSHLSRAKGQVRVVPGDARLSFARTSSSDTVDVEVLDVFSGGAIPVHLLTREALALYLSRLSRDGVILAHVTNRLDLRGVFADLAADAGLSGAAREGEFTAREDRAYSSWVALTPSEKKAAALVARGWKPLSSFARGRRVWTDDYAPLWSALQK